MNSIEFTNILCEPGHLSFNFTETRQDKTRQDSVYIDFDNFIPSDDIIAYVFASLCGSVYDHVYMDLIITYQTYNNIKTWLKADFDVRTIKVCDNISSIHKNTNTIGEKTVINFSGGLDSLALMCCLPPDTHLVSIYFEGFEREYDYFRKFNVHCIKTNVRKKISIDKNTWVFMGLGAILYKEYLNLEYITFGTIAEAAPGLLKRHTPKETDPNFLFNSVGFKMPNFTHALTELGTTFIVAQYMPEELQNSLKSLAPVGSEKLYRKECLVNIACSIMGLPFIVKEYHLPRVKKRFGEYFATDFLSLAIAKYLGISFAAELFTQMPVDFMQFVNSHSLEFYKRIKQDNLTIQPSELREYFINKLTNAGLDFYSENDYQELNTVLQYIQAHSIKS